jgi:hypothetical protein
MQPNRPTSGAVSPGFRCRNYPVYEVSRRGVVCDAPVSTVHFSWLVITKLAKVLPCASGSAADVRAVAKIGPVLKPDFHETVPAEALHIDPYEERGGM